MPEMTKAALAAQFQEQNAGGGNGAGVVPPEPPADQGEYGLPPGVETAADAVAPSFGRKPKVAPAQSPSGVQQKMNQALPPPQSVRISKRLEGGKHAFIGSYSPGEIGVEPGAWQVFIKRHLKQHLTDKENWFLIQSINSNGKLVEHGEHCVIGEMPVGAPGPMATPIMPPPAPTETVRDHIAAMREMEELAEARRKSWIEEQARIRKETEEARAALEAVATQQGAKGDPMMAFMMTQMLQQRRTEAPVRDPREEAEYLDRRIERHLAPLASSMTAGLNGLTERLERVAQVVANPPPQIAPPDPMKTVADLVIALKPERPPEPKDTFTVRDLMAMQQAQEQRLQSLLQLMKPEVPKETFGLRDWIDMQSRQEDRTQRLLERMEASTEKRLADLKELSRERKPEKGTLEALREAKEIAGLLGGDQESGGTLAEVIRLLGTQEAWDGLAGVISVVKGGGEMEEEPEEERPIEVHEGAPQRPAAQPVAAPAARPAKPQPAKPVVIRPVDLGKTDYPEGLDAVVAEVAKVANEEAKDPEGVSAQIRSVFVLFGWLSEHSPEWKRRIQTGVMHIAMRGDKQVLAWLSPFLRGLAKAGKLTLQQVEVLEAAAGQNAAQIVGYVKSRVKQPAPQAKK